VHRELLTLVMIPTGRLRHDCLPVAGLGFPVADLGLHSALSSCFGHHMARNMAGMPHLKPVLVMHPNGPYGRREICPNDDLPRGRRCRDRLALASRDRHEDTDRQ
jgi:hypothetical protein